MKYLRTGSAILFALGMVVLSAGPAPAAQPYWGHGHGGGGQNLSGQYSGTVTDSSLGSGSAVANFAATEESLGGWFGFTFGTTAYSNPSSSSSGRGGTEGVFIMTIGSTACSFVFRAQFDRSSSTLNGKYKAVNGCSGENGTFSLTQQCYYDERGDSARRLAGGPSRC